MKVMMKIMLYEAGGRICLRLEFVKIFRIKDMEHIS